MLAIIDTNTATVFGIVFTFAGLLATQLTMAWISAKNRQKDAADNLQRRQWEKEDREKVAETLRLQNIRTEEHADNFTKRVEENTSLTKEVFTAAKEAASEATVSRISIARKIDDMAGKLPQKANEGERVESLIKDNADLTKEAIVKVEENKTLTKEAISLLDKK